jgi:hypothetical protein
MLFFMQVSCLRVELHSRKQESRAAIPSRCEKLGAVTRLRGRVGDGRAAADTLARRQLAAPVDVLDQQIEGALRMRLDQLDLRE